MILVKLNYSEKYIVLHHDKRSLLNACDCMKYDDEIIYVGY